MSGPVTVPAHRTRRAPPRRGAVRRVATSYLLLAPALVLFGTFVLYPLVAAVRISLSDSTGIGEDSWVGLANYAEMLRDPVLHRAALNTVLLAATSVPLALGAGLGLALLLRGRLPALGLLRAVFLAPYVLSGVVVAIGGRFLFDENVGVVNRGVGALGLPAVPWQSSGPAAALSVLVMLLWARTGLAVVVYITALDAVPADVLEAAALDGANRWQRLRLVVWPLLRPTTFFLTVIFVIETFGVFDLLFVMTGGGPGISTELLVTYAYGQGFEARRLGYGSAVGVLVFVVVLVGTAFWWRARRDSEDVA